MTKHPIETAPTDRSILLGVQGADYVDWRAPCQWSPAGEISKDGFWMWLVPEPEWLVEVQDPTYWAELPG